MNLYKLTLFFVLPFYFVNAIQAQELLRTYTIPSELLESTRLRYYDFEHGLFYASFNKSKTVHVYQLETMQKIREYNLPEWITSLTFSRDGRYLAIGAMGYWVQAWDTLTDTMLLEKQIIPSGAYDNYVMYIDISDHGNYIITCGYHGDRIYSIDKGDSLIIGSTLPELSTYNPTFWPVFILPKDYGIMEIKKNLYLLNFKEEMAIKKIDYQVLCVQNNLALVSTSDHGYQLFDVSNPERWIILKDYGDLFKNYNAYYITSSISKGEQYIYFNSRTDNPAVILDIHTGRLLFEFSGPEYKSVDGSYRPGIIEDISRDGSYLWINIREQTTEELQLWDITNLKAMAEGSSTY